MTHAIPLFKITPLTWEITDPWGFTDPYGAPLTEDLSDRKWLFECDHDGEECSLENASSCGTPFGYQLVQECIGS